MSILPVLPAHMLESCPQERRWLIEDLWMTEAVGIIGGEPKCCKSFLALHMAVAVASGTPCLRRYPVSTAGRVLLFAAEDALHIVRARLEAIAKAIQLNLEALDIQVITAPTVRLDLPDDRRRLTETVEHIRPRLLVLDPFVRLHRIDENVSREVAPLLAFLRDLQRQYQLSVVVVHHARKGAAKSRAGQALRGSSEFHAWGDSNLYLRRRDEHLTLSIEQRAAASQFNIPLRLVFDHCRISLEIDDAPADPSPPSQPDPRTRALHALTEADAPLSLRALRQACRIRTATLCEIMNTLTHQGHVIKSSAGYQLADP